MTDRFELLAQALLMKSFSECTVEELLQLKERYPYLAPAHFLYLKKTDSETPDHKQAMQQALLYYANPAGFQYFIQNHQVDLESEIALEEPLLSQTQKDTITEEEKKAPDVEPVMKITEDFTKAPEQVITSEIEEKVVEPAQNPQDITTTKKHAEIAFEPFHTVDYFASMGIKLNQEDISKDKLGKQLKSFTDWLKVMKKLPAQEKSSVEGREERHVEHMAAFSVKSSDVITESMAEVWLRQGNKAKAIDVYRKLSLLNPGKNAYFAAKIDHLNDSN